MTSFKIINTDDDALDMLKSMLSLDFILLDPKRVNRPELSVNDIQPRGRILVTRSEWKFGEYVVHRSLQFPNTSPFIIHQANFCCFQLYISGEKLDGRISSGEISCQKHWLDESNLAEILCPQSVLKSFYSVVETVIGSRGIMCSGDHYLIMNSARRLLGSPEGFGRAPFPFMDDCDFTQVK